MKKILYIFNDIIFSSVGSKFHVKITEIDAEREPLQGLEVVFKSTEFAIKTHLCAEYVSLCTTSYKSRQDYFHE